MTSEMVSTISINGMQVEASPSWIGILINRATGIREHFTIRDKRVLFFGGFTRPLAGFFYACLIHRIVIGRVFGNLLNGIPVLAYFAISIKPEEVHGDILIIAWPCLVGM